MTRVVIRDLRGMDEYRAAFAFQDEIWGPGFSEGVPASLQKVAQWSGGVAAGAFDGDALVGFVFGITGVREGELVHWSDILAVRRGVRDAGVGSRLKWHQRTRALEAGARTMLWTWDPLEARNGWLNLEKLGATGAGYVEEMYGGSTSPLHTGVGTDRLVARWALDDERVAAAARGDDLPPSAWPTTPAIFAFSLTPRGEPDVDPEAPGVTPPEAGREYRVPIPSDLQRLKRERPGEARLWRTATRAALAPALAGGWRVEGVRRTPDGPPAYRLLHRDLPPVRGLEPPLSG
ncbi:MAG: hypothetical protein RQ745_12170 [Longimicrobiales bacterium]|nr:hypothetical protein [Longimicrobiales bacterium]